MRLNAKLKALFVSALWPEASSSAAGVRSWDLVTFLLNANITVSYLSTSKPNDFTTLLNNKDIKTFYCKLNTPQFNALVTDISPDINLWRNSNTLVFFLTKKIIREEQFSFKVKEVCGEKPLIIVDTQDLHFIRHARQNYLQENIQNQIFPKNYIQDICSFETIEKYKSKTEFQRELSSIYRSDLTFVVSEFEKNLLINNYSIPPEKIQISSFHYSKIEKTKEFEFRQNFMMIGNFRHPPNKDSVLWMTSEIWPHIIKKLPDATLNIYGAYPDKKSINMTDKSKNIFVHGPIKDHLSALSQHRVNLAPLRFGAGIKGKIADGWSVGTPCISTDIGYEGMNLNNDKDNWGGLIANEPEKIAENCVELHENEKIWSKSQKNGENILLELFNRSKNEKNFIDSIFKTLVNKEKLRKQDLVSQILWQEKYLSPKYFSNWVERELPAFTVRPPPLDS